MTERPSTRDPNRSRQLSPAPERSLGQRSLGKVTRLDVARLGAGHVEHGGVGAGRRDVDGVRENRLAVAIEANLVVSGGIAIGRLADGIDGGRSSENGSNRA